MDNRISYFIPKLRGRIHARVKKAWKHLPMEKLCLYSMGEYPGKGVVLQQLKVMLGDVQQNLFDGLSDEIRQQIIILADHTLKHEFNYLGSGWIKNDPICWSKDLASGYEWLMVFFDEVRKNTLKKAEIKSPWELSRSHHLLWLGEAYLFTKESKYAQEIIEEIDDWIDKNPFLYGVNWSCAMDVAIRAVNWLYAINFISKSSELNDVFISKFYKTLYLHGVYIYNNLEKRYPWSNNHYTSNLVGLLYLGVLFGNKRYGKKWLKHGTKEFYSETRDQVMSSGIHYEKSISYHRLMVELTAYPLAMLTRVGKEVPEDILETLQKMYDFVDVYLKPNGKAPLLADNDNGRFLPFSYGDFQEHGYLLAEQSLDNRIVYNGIRPLFKIRKADKYMLYQDAKIAIAKVGEAYLLVNNSDYSRNVEDSDLYIVTHTHNDQLSFELSVGSHDVIVDPGTYIYTSDIKARNNFRSTRKHNTIVVDDEEQNELSLTNAFAVKRNVNIGNLQLKEGYIHGTYSTIEGKLRHERNWELEECRLTISDIVTKSGASHRGRMYFHFGEDVRPELIAGKVFINLNEYTLEMNFQGEGIQTITIDKDTVSPSYGILKESYTAVVEFLFDNETKIETRINWRNNNEE